MVKHMRESPFDRIGGKLDQRKCELKKMSSSNSPYDHYKEQKAPKLNFSFIRNEIRTLIICLNFTVYQNQKSFELAS